MYLSRVVLENFQGFEKGEFVLSPNLNVFVGVSNVGKSSIARALSLVLFNQWDKSWVRHGAKFCKITVETNMGITVLREKGDKVNKYTLLLPNQQPQVYESFGTSVPETIQQALRIYEVPVDSIDTLNLSLAGQMDSTFLLSQTSSYRAKVLGKLSGATFLDHAIRSINLEKKQTSSEKNSKEAELTNVLTQVDKYHSIEGYKTQIDVFEAQAVTLGSKRLRLERIQSLFERVSAWKRNWAREVEIEAVITQFTPLSLVDLDSRLVKFKTLSNLQKHVIQNITEMSNLKNKAHILKAASIVPQDHFQIKTERIKALKALSFNLVKTTTDLSSRAKQLENIILDYEKTKEEYKVLLEQNGECPTCGAVTSVTAQVN